MNNWAIVTIVTRDYLHFARALAASVREVQPEARIVVFLVDSPPVGSNPSLDCFEVVSFDELRISSPRRFLFQYTPFELACALKGFVLDHVFRTATLARLLYFDADIHVYASLTPLLDLLQTHNIVLSPHLTRPRSLGEPDRWEMDVLDTGVFNGGFIGVRNSEAGRAMLAWWQARMRKMCKRSINFVDQGWLSGVPALFDGVYIERGPQYNAAPWNVATRRFSADDSARVYVDGQPLAFFHFAGIEPEQGARLSKASRSPLSEDPPPVQRLYRQYVNRLQACGLQECPRWGYTYARLADGAEIQPEWRELIRIDHPAFRDEANPFALPAAAFRRVALAEHFKQQGRRLLRGLGLKTRRRAIEVSRD